MEIICNIAEMSAWSSAQAAAGKSIAFVPTMGCFHAGHLSLMRQACQLADYLVVSLFVNPLQFGPKEDLETYPRDFDRDAAMASEAGVNVLFAPTAADIYPAGFQSQVNVEVLSQRLCGASRPGHFSGVTTIVAKLFHLVRPQVAVFGRKDFQQLCVISRMVQDLNFGIKIIAHPIVREPDGLAMSSRNCYLSEDERHSALCLYKAIKHARQMVRQGARDTKTVLAAVHGLILTYPSVRIDYISIVDRFALNEQIVIDQDSVLLLAIRLGRTRLIDNDVLLEGDGI